MLARLLPAAALAAVASAQWASTSTTYSFAETCGTAYGSSWVAPIPTSYSRTTSTISSVAPVETTTPTVYVTANTTIATPITLYSDVITTTTLLLDAKTLTVTSTVSSTIATLTTKTTVCANGPAPSYTATEYTGTYVPVPGQDTVLPSSYETLDACFFTESAILHVFPTTLASTTATTTIPFTTASPTIWTTETNTQTVTQYRSTLTVTTTAYSFHVDLTTTTISSSACAATPTVTYAARCAPQNLLASFSGVGLALGDLSTNANFTFGGVAGMAAGDPGLCCQLCVDNDRCAASVYWAQSSSCLLGYVGGEGEGGDECPVAFSYYAANYTEVPTKPRQGNILQVGAGCARIEYEGVRSS